MKFTRTVLATALLAGTGVAHNADDFWGSDNPKFYVSWAKGL